MDFIFQGFQSTLPTWFYLLIFAVCSFFAWWSYSNMKGISKSFRYLLITLRSAVFFILLLLLLNPFFQSERTYFTKPNILVMLDNSASTSVGKGQYQGIESYQNLLDKLNFDDSSSVNFDFFSIGSAINPISPGRLSFEKDQTNLANAMQFIEGKETQAKAVIVITDGIYTEGENPVFGVSGIDIPIFTIGIGDTTSQKDALVKSVVTNSTGYLNTDQAVEVTVSSKGFKGESFQVRLLRGDEIVDTKTITPAISNSVQNISFELSLEEKGLQQFEVMIPTLSGEWISANNSQLFSINVQDARQQVLSIAFEVHPDVGFVRSLLSSDRHIRLTNRTWLNGNRFIEGPLSIDPDTVDLAIIHGFPRSGLPDKTQQFLTELAQKVPLIIATTPRFSPESFEREITSLPVKASALWKYHLVEVTPQMETDHPILDLPPVNFEQIPRLFAPAQNLNAVPGATAILNSKYQDQPAVAPLLAVRETGNKRTAIFTGFGWSRLSQSPNARAGAFVNQLWLNTISWAAADPDNQNLKVKPAQTPFSGTEPVVINAFLKNERGEIESQADIEISISSDSISTQFYSMENKGSGQYRLNLGPMPEGIYSFKAVARKKNRTLGVQPGEFSVAPSNAEFINMERNDQLLRQLAQRTGGIYVPFDSVSGFWEQLNKQGLLEQIKEIETAFWYPYQHLLWFLLVVILLSAEWIFRKYLSLP